MSCLLICSQFLFHFPSPGMTLQKWLVWPLFLLERMRSAVTSCFSKRSECLVSDYFCKGGHVFACFVCLSAVDSGKNDGLSVCMGKNPFNYWNGSQSQGGYTNCFILLRNMLLVMHTSENPVGGSNCLQWQRSQFSEYSISQSTFMMAVSLQVSGDIHSHFLYVPYKSYLFYFQYRFS